MGLLFLPGRLLIKLASIHDKDGESICVIVIAIVLLLLSMPCYFMRRLLIGLASIHDKGERGECLFCQLSGWSSPALCHLTVTMYTDTRILNVKMSKLKTIKLGYTFLGP